MHSTKTIIVDTAVKTQPIANNKISSNTPVEEIHRIFQLQQKNKQNVKNTTAKERKKKLNALKRMIFDRREDIQQALYKDFRKAPAETDLTEIYPTVSEIRHAAGRLSDWMRPHKVETPLSFFGTSSKIIYEPKGVVLNISPWNYPFQLCLIPLVSIIAAGNCAMLKPSEFTPHTTKAIKELLAKVFNEDEVAVIEGDHTVSSELLKLKFDHIVFTGSPGVGKIVMKAAAEHLTPVTLELGGKSPVVVDETAAVKAAAKRITWGKLVNSGQTCIAPDYLMVHEKKYDALLEELKNSIENSYGKDQQQSEDYCRIINNRHHARIKQLIEDAVEKGANVYYGGKVDDNEDYISPTILTDVPEDAAIMQEEIFGPVLPVMKYRDLSEPLKLINSKEKPLALYVFSKNKKNIDTVLHNTSSGGTSINDTLLHNTQPNLPFGGVNNSGIGSLHGLFGFKALSHERGILKQHMGRGSAENMYPPYTGFVKKMIDFTLKYL